MAVATLSSMNEVTVERALGIGGDEFLQEIGVFPAPAPDQEPDRVPRLDALPGPDEIVLTEEWLSAVDLEIHFSSDGRLEGALPGRVGRALRLDIDPSVLVFEHLPWPANSLGSVHPAGDGRWIMDTRGGPAALVIPDGDHDLVIWGERGTVRMFALRPPRP
jgi:hypothetical protein